MHIVFYAILLFNLAEILRVAAKYKFYPIASFSSKRLCKTRREESRWKNIKKRRLARG